MGLKIKVVGYVNSGKSLVAGLIAAGLQGVGAGAKLSDVDQPQGVDYARLGWLAGELSKHGTNTNKLEVVLEATEEPGIVVEVVQVGRLGEGVVLLGPGTPNCT